MPNTKQIKMEDMSVAYLRALCAANGYTLKNEEHDNDGVDITVKCKGKPADDSLRVSPSFDVQLKSSSSPSLINVNEDGSVTYKLEVKNYNILIDPDRFNPIILVVLVMKENEDDWLEQTVDYLKMTKCAYWISLKGLEHSNNTERKTITIPANHVLSRESLKDIMIKVSKDEDLL
jgi:hypothetical protein